MAEVIDSVPSVYAFRLVLVIVSLTAGPLFADDRPSGASVSIIQQNFDADPGWDGFRNQLQPPSNGRVVQNFGWSCSRFAGGRACGEIGGRVQRSLSRARYSMPLETVLNLDSRLEASGRMAVRNGQGAAGVLVGWFHETSDGWRTPDSVAMRVDGNGDSYWLFAEYGTHHRKTGGLGAFEGERYQTTPTLPFAADGTSHLWKLTYDPQAGEYGELQFQIDDREYVVRLSEEARGDGAFFNRFGIWNQQTTGDSLELWIDDLTFNGRHFDFRSDPGWAGEGNVVEIDQTVVRPFHQFGYSASNHAGGDQGELGGIIWRDEQPGYYGASVGELTLDDRLQASGTLALRSAGADSAVYLGWFNSATKRAATQPEYERRQSDYLGILLEGPSRAGHYFRPGYGTSQASGANADRGPIVLPDGQVHQWSVDYDPTTAQITVLLDGQEVVLALPHEHLQQGAVFDRFGLFNMQSGGWHVEVYFDDVTYTARVEQDRD